MMSDKTSPTHVCGVDVGSVIDFHMKRVSGAQAMSEVALMGAASAMGTAAGAFYALHEARLGEASEDHVAEALWSILKPMVSRSFAKLRATKSMEA